MPDTSRALFLKMLDRPRVAAELNVTGDAFTYHAEAGESVPGIILRPVAASATKMPIVIALHGTGGTKEGMLPVMRQLAAQGCMSVAIDGRFHGARATRKTAYADAILQAWRTGAGKPFLYDTAWDVMRLVDAIAEIPGADPSRLGVLGVSKGGMEAYLTAAADERIKAVVPCIAAQSFRWGVEHDAWQARVSTFQSAFDTAAREKGEAADGAFARQFYDRVAPGLCAEFDGPAMLPLIAPRGLYTVNGELDPRCPLPGLQLCLDAAKAAYAQTPDRFRYVIQPATAHKVNADAMSAAVTWLSHFL